MNRLLAPVVGAPIIALGLIVFAVVGSLPSYAQNSGGQPQSAATPAPASAPAAQDSGSANTAKPDAASGARIAESGTEVGAAACASCHNPDGSGNPDTQAPRLAGQVAAYLHKQLDDYASGARKNDIMAPIAQALSDADKANVAAHYAETRAPYPPLGQTDPQKVRAGQKTLCELER